MDSMIFTQMMLSTSASKKIVLDLLGVTEFKRGANGVIELKFVDRGKLLERLLDAADHSGEEQIDRFLRAMEGEVV